MANKLFKELQRLRLKREIYCLKESREGAEESQINRAQRPRTCNGQNRVYRFLRVEVRVGRGGDREKEETAYKKQQTVVLGQPQ